MAEEVKPVAGDAAPATKAVAPVAPAAKKATKKVKAGVVAPVAADSKAVEPAVSTNGADALMGELKATFKDVTGQMEKLPVTKQVIGAANRVADELEKNPMAAKVIEQVKTTADQLENSKIAADMRSAARSAREGIEKSPLTTTIHKMLLASIGAVAIAQEEIEDLVNRLVERGEIAESDGKRMLKDVLEKRKQAMDKASAVASEMAETPKRVADDVEKRVESVLAKMNIPSKDEIESLSAKITALTRKVDELKKQQ